MNYVRNLNPSVIEYNDSTEDQDVKPEDVLKYEYSDDLSLDYWVYDEHSVDDIPDDQSVDSPLKDMYVLNFIREPSEIQSPDSCG